MYQKMIIDKRIKNMRSGSMAKRSLPVNA